MPSSRPLNEDPRYQNMTLEAARYILDRFAAEFDDLADAQKTEEGRIAASLWCVAVGWLVEHDLWREAGLDPRFVELLQA